MAGIRRWVFPSCSKLRNNLSLDTSQRVGQPLPNQVVVKMLSASIQPQDFCMLHGTYGGYQHESYPAVGGTEGVGKVMQAGNACSRLKEGDKVVFNRQNVGTWADHITTLEENLDCIGQDVSAPDSQLACLSIPSSAILMHRMVGSFSPDPSGPCWVLGADNAVGAALTTYLGLKGCKVVAVADKWKGDGKAQMVSNADLETKAAGLPAPCMIFNGSGGPALRIATDCAAEGATVVTYANLSGTRMDVAGSRMVMNSTQMVPFWYNRWLHQSTEEERAAVYKEAATLMQKKAFEPVEFKFNDFPKAFNKALDGELAVVTF